jgi:uncharacterized protein YbjT (DUF2867 family)
MSTVLVTGGTGHLGVPTVAALDAAGHTVRVLSRGGAVQRRSEVVTSGDVGRGDLLPAVVVPGDLVTGAGIAKAIADVDIVIHLATTGGTDDVPAAQTLMAACKRAGVRHLIVISIVGIDEIPLAYYRLKLEIESLAEIATVPHTILRATQFHSFVERLFSAQGLLPVRFAPSFSFQPIAVEDVAVRLTELAGMNAAGRVPDIGGPEQRTAHDLAQAWSTAAGSVRPIWPLRLPGRTFNGFAAGHNLVPGRPYGVRTFEEYLELHHPVAG